MSTPHLGAEQLELLGRYNTPTISNAIELFDVRPRHTGYLPHFIRCLLPELGVIVGYAVTCQTTAIPPAAGEQEADLLADYLRYVASEPGPKIAVGEDIDDPPGLGAEFGEVTATIHRKLGCVGHITSGCPRRPRRGEGAGVPALRPGSLCEPCLCSARRFWQAGHSGRRHHPVWRLASRRSARRLHRASRNRAEAGRGLCGGGTPRAATAGNLPITGIFARSLHRAPNPATVQDPRVK